MRTNFVFLGLLLSAFSSFAQQGVSNFQIQTDPQSTAAITSAMSEAEVTSALNAISNKVTFVLTLEDAAAAKVHVKFGTDSLGSKFNEIINTNGSELPQGVSVIKNGNEIQITIGLYNGILHYLAAVEIESASGIKSRMYQINH
jgi:glutaminase